MRLMYSKEVDWKGRRKEIKGTFESRYRSRVSSSVLGGQLGPVTSIAVRPQGSYVASGGECSMLNWVLTSLPTHLGLHSHLLKEDDVDY